MDKYKERIQQAIAYAEKTGSFSRLALLEKAEHVCVYGLGKYFEDTFLRRCVKEIFHVDMLCDIDPEKTKKFVTQPGYEGLKAVSLDELSQYNSVYIIVMLWPSEKTDEILADMRKRIAPQHCVYYLDLTLDYEVCSDPKYKDLSFFQHQYEDILKVLDFLKDDQSRNDYVNTLCNRIAPHMVQTRNCLSFDTQYFEDSIYKLTDHESIVDAGAFNGDTLAQFLRVSNSKFDFYCAIEMEKDNANKLKSYINQLPMQIQTKVAFYLKALWYKNEMLSFQRETSQIGTSGTGCSIYNQNQFFGKTVQIQAVKLDDLMKNKKVTLLKMDIEGAELKALQGAQNIIRTQKPKLAICVYHHMEDMWKIPLYLHELVPEYIFHMRHYGSQLSSDETICYATL